MISLWILAGLPALYIASITLKWISEWWRFRQAATKYGCKRPNCVRDLDPFFGYDFYSKMTKADHAGQHAQFFYELHKTYGKTFQYNVLGDRRIVTALPENIRAIAISQFDDFGVEPQRGNNTAPLMESGVFTHDGETWKNAKAVIKPIFDRSEVADLDNFETHVSRFFSLIPSDASTIDIRGLLQRLFLDTSTEFIFGRSVESLLPEVDESEFISAFDRSIRGMSRRLIAGPSFQFLFAFDRSYKQNYTKVHNFVDKQIQIAMEDQRSGKLQTDGKYILLRELLKKIQDPREIRSQVINIFFPARGTVAFAFSFAMQELARHPDAWEELREEVKAIGDRKLTFEFLKSLKVAKAIINETLRLHPLASSVSKTALRDTILPVGGGVDGTAPLFVPKGTNVLSDLYTIQNDPDIWGDDFDEFRISRWSEGRPLWEVKWQYEPFFGGPRMCPARMQALTQITYLLVRMAQEFKTIENREVKLDYVEVNDVTYDNVKGVRIGLVRA
ncbi:cytochrome P450 alkane hydroxylase-like protein [Xylogone sp. PMI_703]|nr:cytochrome P450 alkane hydroxylase-like protein [Xylogone sp. PMI_703]